MNEKMADESLVVIHEVLLPVSTANYNATKNRYALLADIGTKERKGRCLRRSLSLNYTDKISYSKLILRNTKLRFEGIPLILNFS
jgi:hypothetical protein